MDKVPVNDIEQLRKLVDGYIESVHTQDKEAFCAIWSKKSECSLISIANEYRGLRSIYDDFLIGRNASGAMMMKLSASQVWKHSWP